MRKQGGVTRRRALRAGGPGGLAGLGVSREPGCVLRGALVLRPCLDVRVVGLLLAKCRIL